MRLLPQKSTALHAAYGGLPYPVAGGKVYLSFCGSENLSSLLGVNFPRTAVVLSLRDRLQMVCTHARSHMAQMIQVQAMRDSAKRRFVGNSVGEKEFSLPSSHTFNAVSTLLDPKLPYVARSLVTSIFFNPSRFFSRAVRHWWEYNNDGYQEVIAS